MTAATLQSQFQIRKMQAICDLVHRLLLYRMRGRKTQALLEVFYFYGHQ